MTTNIRPGMRIKIAVPITPGDNSPFEKRKEFRIAIVERVREDGTLEETEGTVRADRMGFDWELSEGEDSADGMVVVRLAEGPILARVIKVEGNLVSLYSEQMIPPGSLSVPARVCGKSWDWLRGRSVGSVFVTLGEIWDPQGKVSAPPTVAGTGPAPSDGKPGKKRGPKPRQMALTAETAALAAVPGKTVSASDPADAPVTCPRLFTFKERARLWHAVCELQKAAESEGPQWMTGALPDAIRAMDGTLSEICKAGGHV